MRRVAWRKFLPVVQLATYLALVWHGCWYRPTWQYWFDNWMSPGSEPAGFVADWIDGIEPLSEQLAAGVNYPATVLAVLSLIPFEGSLPSGASRELALHALTAFYIPLLWYLIGRRIDRRDLKRAGPFSARRKALAVIAITGLLLLSFLPVWSFTYGQRYAMNGLALLWIVGALIVLSIRLRAPRSQALSA